MTSIFHYQNKHNDNTYNYNLGVWKWIERLVHTPWEPQRHKSLKEKSSQISILVIGKNVYSVFKLLRKLEMIKNLWPWGIHYFFLNYSIQCNMIDEINCLVGVLFSFYLYLWNIKRDWQCLWFMCNWHRSEPYGGKR